jgi:hypothetical protein
VGGGRILPPSTGSIESRAVRSFQYYVRVP